MCGVDPLCHQVLLGLRGYGSAVDMWSAGVMLFIMLGGHLPFHSHNRAHPFDQICRGDFSFTRKEWLLVSERWVERKQV